MTAPATATSKRSLRYFFLQKKGCELEVFFFPTKKNSHKLQTLASATSFTTKMKLGSFKLQNKLRPTQPRTAKSTAATAHRGRRRAQRQRHTADGEERNGNGAQRTAKSAAATAHRGRRRAQRQRRTADGDERSDNRGRRRA